MAQSASNNSGKKLIHIDVSSDTICPWCFVGKKNLDKAIAALKDKYNFEIKWHPFFLNPSAPKEGINKLQYYREKFGSRTEGIIARMTEVFRGLGMEYNISGLTGNTLDSHRLIYFAGQQGLDKQHKLTEELFLGYFTQAKYIGDREFLLECATKAGVEGAAEFLENPNNGVKEFSIMLYLNPAYHDAKCFPSMLKAIKQMRVEEDLQKYSANIKGAPYYVLNGKHKLSGGQPCEVFLRAFEAA